MGTHRRVPDETRERVLRYIARFGEAVSAFVKIISDHREYIDDDNISDILDTLDNGREMCIAMVATFPDNYAISDEQMNRLVKLLENFENFFTDITRTLQRLEHSVRNSIEIAPLARAFESTLDSYVTPIENLLEGVA